MEDYKIKNKKNEMYNSYWKGCKEVIDSAIRNNKSSCKITLSAIAHEEDIVIIQDVLKMINTAIKNIYNCNVDIDYAGNTYIFKISWEDNDVVPYKDNEEDDWS